MAVGGLVNGVTLLQGLHPQPVEFIGKIGADRGPALAFYPVGFGNRVVIHRAVGEHDLNGQIISGTAVQFRHHGGDRTVLESPGLGMVASDQVARLNILDVLAGAVGHQDLGSGDEAFYLPGMTGYGREHQYCHDEPAISEDLHALAPSMRMHAGALQAVPFVFSTNRIEVSRHTIPTTSRYWCWIACHPHTHNRYSSVVPSYCAVNDFLSIMRKKHGSYRLRSTRR